MDIFKLLKQEEEAGIRERFQEDARSLLSNKIGAASQRRDRMTPLRVQILELLDGGHRIEATASTRLHGDRTIQGVHINAGTFRWLSDERLIEPEFKNADTRKIGATHRITQKGLAYLTEHRERIPRKSSR